MLLGLVQDTRVPVEGADNPWILRLMCTRIAAWIATATRIPRTLAQNPAPAESST
jgi:hypothetical protein